MKKYALKQQQHGGDRKEGRKEAERASPRGFARLLTADDVTVREPSADASAVMTNVSF